MEAGVDGRPDAEREANQDAMDIDSNNQTFIPGRSNITTGPDTKSRPVYLRNCSTSCQQPGPVCLSILFATILETTASPTLALSMLSPVLRQTLLGPKRTSFTSSNYPVSPKWTGATRQTRSQTMTLTTRTSLQTRYWNPSQSLYRARQTAFAHTNYRQQDPSIIPTTLTATWLESGEIMVHDVTPQLQAFSTPGFTIPPNASKPLSTLRMHRHRRIRPRLGAFHPLAPRPPTLRRQQRPDLQHPTHRRRRVCYR